MTAKDLEESRTIKTVPCSNCGRGFTADRIQTHTSICSKQKPRKVYDITRKRVQGTEAEELVRTGRLKLDPPRPNEKKSALHDKTLTKNVLPPIPSKKGRNSRESENRSTTAYQVVFDNNDNIKTKKNSKYPSAIPPHRGGKKLPATKVDIDQRYLSAERAKGHWQSAAVKARPQLSATMSDHDEDDYLDSSQKTVRSDAFDFLFDSQNLNPERLLDHGEIERYTEEKNEGDQQQQKHG